MDVTLPSLLEAFLLVAAVSLDAFVASFAYGTNKIKIPVTSLIVISVICSGMLAFFRFFAFAVSAAGGHYRHPLFYPFSAGRRQTFR